ncbi:OmpA family protein [Mesorhizobium sp. BAC0120]|uniref:OmpA family protein n=1 Tax=Mesorhizobium sp. BAC0120 TaxID=3090670 RepID=UPI00298D22DD|nr:OmpA family protein [Mesorhizobium sp. BAC0120]MDW6020736.1 OmpA family protein [Mesorhizobium sp. BAC0120]
MNAVNGLTRAAACAGLLMLAAACTSTTLSTPTNNAPGNDAELKVVTSGQTNEAAPGFENLQPGSEEDFVLNVGRRTFFPQGSATLDSTAKATLDTQIAWLKKYPQWLVKLQGFADDGSGDSQQVALSQKRADAVMAYLAAGGIDSKRMWAKGYGKDRLVRDCPDRSCKVQNRRVVTNLRNERDTS